MGVDVSEYAVASAVEGAQGRLRVQSLTEDLGGQWDLVTCIEVLEHMTPPDTQLAIDRICATTDRVLLSSTPHDLRRTITRQCPSGRELGVWSAAK